jgi:hypothetical protein
MMQHRNVFLDKVNSELQLRLDTSDKEQLQIRTELEAQVWTLHRHVHSTECTHAPIATTSSLHS